MIKVNLLFNVFIANLINYFNVHSFKLLKRNHTLLEMGTKSKAKLFELTI